jgi:hypothetical protein
LRGGRLVRTFSERDSWREGRGGTPSRKVFTTRSCISCEDGYGGTPVVSLPKMHSVRIEVQLSRGEAMRPTWNSDSLCIDGATTCNLGSCRRPRIPTCARVVSMSTALQREGEREGLKRTSHSRGPKSSFAHRRPEIPGGHGGRGARPTKAARHRTSGLEEWSRARKALFTRATCRRSMGCRWPRTYSTMMRLGVACPGENCNRPRVGCQWACQERD